MKLKLLTPQKSVKKKYAHLKQKYNIYKKPSKSRERMSSGFQLFNHSIDKKRQSVTLSY